MRAVLKSAINNSKLGLKLAQKMAKSPFTCLEQNKTTARERLLANLVID